MKWFGVTLSVHHKASCDHSHAQKGNDHCIHSYPCKPLNHFCRTFEEILSNCVHSSENFSTNRRNTESFSWPAWKLHQSSAASFGVWGSGTIAYPGSEGHLRKGSTARSENPNKHVWAPSPQISNPGDQPSSERFS